MPYIPYKKPEVRPHFYKDAYGNIKRYLYCSLCLKGPFKQDQLDNDVFYMSGIDTKIYYCVDCKKNQIVPKESV